MCVICIKCGKPADETRLGIEATTGTIHCSECDEEYDVAEVEAVVAGWARLIPWIKSHPDYKAAADGPVKLAVA